MGHVSHVPPYCYMWHPDDTKILTADLEEGCPIIDILGADIHSTYTCKQCAPTNLPHLQSTSPLNHLSVLPNFFQPQTKVSRPQIQNMVLISFFYSTQCPQDEVQVPLMRFKSLCTLDTFHILQSHLSLLPNTSCHSRWTSLSILSVTSFGKPCPRAFAQTDTPTRIGGSITVGFAFTSDVNLRKLLNSFKPLLPPLEGGEMIYLSGLVKAKWDHTYKSCLTCRQDKHSMITSCYYLLVSVQSLASLPGCLPILPPPWSLPYFSPSLNSYNIYHQHHSLSQLSLCAPYYLQYMNLWLSP